MRPALELAVVVARRGAAEDPPVDAPRGLRPILGFTKLSVTALARVRRALDDDADFRRRVAAEAGDACSEGDDGGRSAVGRAGWLFLHRPEGWADELDALAEAGAVSAAAQEDQRQERSARRRLPAVEEAAKRAEDQLVATRARLAGAEAALAVERRQREAAERELAGLKDRVESVGRERDAARRQGVAATTRADRLEAEALRQRATLDLGDARYGRGDPAGAAAGPESGHGVTPSRSGGGEVLGVAAGGGAPGGTPPADRSVAPTDARTGPAVPGTADPPGSDGAAPASALAVPMVVLEDVRAAVGRAATAAADLAGALEAAASALALAEPDADRLEVALEPAGNAAAGLEPARSARPPAGRHLGPLVRLPVVLPPGLLDDQHEAAEFLVRVPDVLVVVDGYNASLQRWPDRPIAEQRRRLQDALSGLAARTGAAVDLVFDGVEVAGRSITSPRRGVRVLFSARSEEADDVILLLVERAPLYRPVVVATDDRRVRRGAAARGANVVTQRQVFTLLG